MLDVRNRVVRRWAAAVAVVALATVPTTTAAASPGQEPPAPDERASGDDLLVDVDVLVSTSAAAVASTLDELGTQIAEQLGAYKQAQEAVDAATQKLADADAALNETVFLIEETTIASDEVVIEAYINPPRDRVLDVLTAETPADATVKQALIDMDTDRAADSLTEYQDALASYETLKEEQLAAHNEAETARAEAEAALADLEATLSTQAQFVTEVQAALASDVQASDDPEAVARRTEIAAALDAAAELAAIREAERLAEEERRRKVEAGIMFCPVDGPVDFIDSWGFARSGGRTHKGVDMMAARGTPTVAPVSGRVVHRGTSLGGLSWYVYGDNGNTYYGTHLAGYANQGAGRVEAGTVIGYVGDTGNAAGNPHLHFEIHPGGGSPVNPYPATAAACFG
ncbi:MAG TPA: M23 family metallopeptidase [Acidimicrobiales bacterium]